MNMRYVVKLEMGGLEQSYKIRESDDINSIDAIRELIDESFINSCLSRFKEMQGDLGNVLERYVIGH